MLLEEEEVQVSAPGLSRNIGHLCPDARNFLKDFPLVPDRFRTVRLAGCYQCQNVVSNDRVPTILHAPEKTQTHGVLRIVAVHLARV